MSTIFISYRRKESRPHARLLFSELQHHFSGQVFMDVDGLKPGENFRKRLERQLQGCRVMIAVIGPDWHSATDDHGQIRLQQSSDWVRMEIAFALQSGIPVIPVLIENARMPAEPQLPPDLHALLDFQALPLDLDRFFDSAMQSLKESVERLLTSFPRLPCAKFQSEHDEFETPWADVDIFDVMQRFRWIRPGTFLMGCDPDDPNGDDDEKPQHRVTLTRGFWLADTACTQRLWQAVTEQNPSQFKGSAELPVEKVSWDAVTGLFLPKVSQKLGVPAALPTEAEWEYACRAGTQTPYWFGQTITAQQANFRGSGRDKTVDVKALPANGWGLYQMHGNVWEWCAGSWHRYAEQAVTDPPDGQNQVLRALRGGAWSDSPCDARAAYRIQGHRSSDWFGRYSFRFVLRPTSQE